jgi:hypothetical protein
VGNTPRTYAIRVMALIRSHRLDTWYIRSRDLVSRQSRFRLRRYPRSPFIYVRELVQGKQVREFSLGPLEHGNAADVEKVRDLCLEGHRSGQWPAHCLGKPGTPVSSPRASP